MVNVKGTILRPVRMWQARQKTACATADRIPAGQNLVSQLEVG